MSLLHVIFFYTLEKERGRERGDSSFPPLNLLNNNAKCIAAHYHPQIHFFEYMGGYDNIK